MIPIEINKNKLCYNRTNMFFNIRSILNSEEEKLNFREKRTKIINTEMKFNLLIKKERKLPKI